MPRMPEDRRRRAPKGARGATMVRILLGCLLLGGVAVGSGCASDSGASAQPRTFADAAERLYQAAQTDLKKGNTLEAISQFNALRNTFPYSKYAPLAELGIGDAYFAQESYATAVQQYRSFVQLHPSHAKVAYAQWRVADAFYQLMPEDWWLLPPAYERNLRKTEDAVRELDRFAKAYPQSEYAAEANKRLGIARRRLADHELYVAKFYFERDNPKAAGMRLRYLLKNYSGLGLDPQALFLLARSYIELGELPRAQTALNDLIKYHPNSDLAGKARDYLRRYNLDKKG
ncbi:Beta-barrel assembly machine subunit BamD [Bradymonas sediminis]|nr:Beta-barrel assembly machine subunit BamD [Bradymonas sediminis]